MSVLITGAEGFIGSNLAVQLRDGWGLSIVPYDRRSSTDDLKRAIAEVDAICHLAGVNRPDDVAEFGRVNTEFTRTLCDEVRQSGRLIPILFASSVQADRDNPYGASKQAAERLLLEHAALTGAPVNIFRLANVFGKWCRPNYNSVVATFCYNIGRDLPVRIDDPASPLQLVYIDDVVETFGRLLIGEEHVGVFVEVRPTYLLTVGELAEQIRAFRASRESLVCDRVGAGLARALYATYVSHLPTETFAYDVPKHEDARGVFVEMLKTRDSGQFSFFTAHPGVTRGGHYHHSKTEKFLVLKGTAKFRFRNIVSNAVHELVTSGDTPQIVDIAPGWTHDITNAGDEEMIVMLWANEVFDRERPDTFACPVQI